MAKNITLKHLHKDLRINHFKEQLTTDFVETEMDICGCSVKYIKDDVVLFCLMENKDVSDAVFLVLKEDLFKKYKKTYELSNVETRGVISKTISDLININNNILVLNEL